MKTMANIDEKKDELIHLIKTRFVNSKGLLARTYPVNNRSIFNDFDDICPFFIYFKETNFLLKQIAIIQRNNESMISLCAENGALITRNIDEWFGGLYCLWKETDDNRTYQLLTESIDIVIKPMMRNTYLPAAYFPNKKRITNYYESWSSGLLECFCEMRSDFTLAFKTAEKVLQSWLLNSYFREHSLMPYRVFQSKVVTAIHNIFLINRFPNNSNSRPSHPFQRKNLYYGTLRKIKNNVISVYGSNSLYSQLMKSNSTFAFTLLEFYRATGKQFWLENLIRWIESVIRNFFNYGKVFMEYVPSTGIKRNSGVVPAFILVDILCDTIYFAHEHILKENRERYCQVIKQILEHYWGSRLKNGLIPQHDSAKFAHIDNQVYFSISLRRYAELSGEKIYKDRSIELTQTVIKEHYSSNGYLTYSGEIIGKNIIDPKYNALLLKGFINLSTIDESIYSGYHSLFKDR